MVLSSGSSHATRARKTLETLEDVRRKLTAQYAKLQPPDLDGPFDDAANLVRKTNIVGMQSVLVYPLITTTSKDQLLLRNTHFFIIITHSASRQTNARCECKRRHDL